MWAGGVFRADHLELDKSPCKGEASESEHGYSCLWSRSREGYRMSQGNSKGQSIFSRIVCSRDVTQCAGAEQRAHEEGSGFGQVGRGLTISTLMY